MKKPRNDMSGSEFREGHSEPSFLTCKQTIDSTFRFLERGSFRKGFRTKRKLPKKGKIGPHGMHGNLPTGAVMHQLNLVAAILWHDALLHEEFP